VISGSHKHPGRSYPDQTRQARRALAPANETSPERRYAQKTKQPELNGQGFCTHKPGFSQWGGRLCPPIFAQGFRSGSVRHIDRRVFAGSADNSPLRRGELQPIAVYCRFWRQLLRSSAGGRRVLPELPVVGPRMAAHGSLWQVFGPGRVVSCQLQNCWSPAFRRSPGRLKPGLQLWTFFALHPLAPPLPLGEVVPAGRVRGLAPVITRHQRR
jgi:hypothetical protein